MTDPMALVLGIIYIVLFVLNILYICVVRTRYVPNVNVVIVLVFNRFLVACLPNRGPPGNFFFYMYAMKGSLVMIRMFSTESHSLSPSLRFASTPSKNTGKQASAKIPSC